MGEKGGEKHKAFAANNLNVLSPINLLSFGLIGLNVLLECKKLGVQPALWPIGSPEAEPQHHEIVRDAVQAAKLYDPSSPCLTVWHPFDLARRVGRGPHSAIAIFELDRFSEGEAHHLRNLDVVFAPSEWAADVLIESGVDPARIAFAPLGVDPEVFRPTPLREGPTTFLNVGKWEVRKGHDVLCEAFNKAFVEGDDVRLVLHTHNPFYSAEESRNWERYYKNSTLGHKIEVRNDRLPTHDAVRSLMAQADCGVFPSRSEAWGMPIGEMMAMGRHIITTNYSGMTEFCNRDNSHLIDVGDLEDAFDGKWFFGQGRWAAYGPDQIDQLVSHMRAVHRKKQEGRLSLNEDGVNTMRSYTWGHTVRAILETLSSSYAL